MPVETIAAALAELEAGTIDLPAFRDAIFAIINS
jgi:hypothetical protein